MQLKALGVIGKSPMVKNQIHLLDRAAAMATDEVSKPAEREAGQEMELKEYFLLLVLAGHSIILPLVPKRHLAATIPRRRKVRSEG